MFRLTKHKKEKEEPTELTEELLPIRPCPVMLRCGQLSMRDPLRRIMISSLDLVENKRRDSS
jgi:hypothetical protein